MFPFDIIILVARLQHSRRESDGTEGVTTEDNPAYDLNHFHKSHGKTTDEYDSIQSHSAAAAPQETVYERVF